MLFSSRRRSEREAAQRIYLRLAQQARQPVFFEAWGVPDSMEGRFEMLALHLFIVTERLMDPAVPEPELARMVGEAFFTDMDAAFREMGVGDLSVPKRIKSLYRSYGGRLQAYQAGLHGEDGMLVAAIERNIFPEGDLTAASPRLAAYAATAIRALRAVGVHDLRQGTLPFPEPGGRAVMEGEGP